MNERRNENRTRNNLERHEGNNYERHGGNNYERHEVRRNYAAVVNVRHSSEYDGNDEQHCNNDGNRNENHIFEDFDYLKTIARAQMSF